MKDKDIKNTCMRIRVTFCQTGSPKEEILITGRSEHVILNLIGEAYKQASDLERKDINSSLFYFLFPEHEQCDCIMLDQTPSYTACHYHILIGLKKNGHWDVVVEEPTTHDIYANDPRPANLREVYHFTLTPEKVNRLYKVHWTPRPNDYFVDTRMRSVPLDYISAYLLAEQLRANKYTTAVFMRKMSNKKPKNGVYIAV